MTVRGIKLAITKLDSTQIRHLLDWLETYAAQLDHPNECEEQSDSEKAVSAYDVSKHLAGIIKGGPGDLSSNPSYLDDLGASSM